jgi:transposase
MATGEAAKNVALLPPSGTRPDGAPTRSKTQFTRGAQGRKTMRIVALDLGAKKISYCEVHRGKVVRRMTVSQISSLRSELGPDRPAARVVIEAGREAWHVHDLLVAWGNEVVVADTTRIRRAGIGDHGRKNDRIDAETLARALEENRIPKAHVLSPQRRELRRVLGVRRALVESRAQMVTTVRGLVREQGGKLPTCDTAQFVGHVRKQKLPPEISGLIEPLLLLVEGIDAQLAATEERLASLCSHVPIIAALTTAPGVGTVVAAAFVSVVDEAKRFRNAHQVESYIGLVPCEDSSGGGKQRLGAITKQGNKYLRALLVQAAWSILTKKKSDPLHLWAAKVAKRRGKRIAAIALARRLVGVLWAMWRDGTVYDPEHLAQQGIRGLRGAVQSLEQQQAVLARAAAKNSVMKPSAAKPSRSPKTSAAKAA